jgi:hypothetical protein
MTRRVGERNSFDTEDFFRIVTYIIKA